MSSRAQLAIAALVCTVAASAQIVNTNVLDSFQVNYAANLNHGDAVVNITNDGASIQAGSGGLLCVNVYTFDAGEEMLSCCTCTVTPNGLVSLSVKNSLLASTSTGARPSSVVIKLVTTSNPGTTCDASNVTAAQLAPGMRAWGTVLHPAPAGYQLSENPFSTAALSAAELTHLTNFCEAIETNGSGSGLCLGCPTGGLGAASRL